MHNNLMISAFIITLLYYGVKKISDADIIVIYQHLLNVLLFYCNMF